MKQSKLVLLLVVFGLLSGAALAETPPRQLPMFDGKTGDPVSWDALLGRAAKARVVVIGEQHDDPSGHRFEAAFVSDLLDRNPDAALSLEMFGRDEQAIVDHYLQGKISVADLAKNSQAEKWGGKENWKVWYLPMIDAARARGAAVIAANAPARFTRLAREFGLATLLVLKPRDQKLYALPRPAPDREYSKRFHDIMSPSPSATAERDPDPHNPHALSDEQIKNFYRAQQVWDATMASSIVRAALHHRQVIHVVGQFHSDLNGGLIQQIRARNPFLPILTISLQRGDSATLRDDDVGRAGIVVYTQTTEEEE